MDLFPNLPSWMRDTEPRQLAAALQSLWARWQVWLEAVPTQADIRNCSEGALELFAWERGVDRLTGESVALWRDRTQHAITVAIDSGSLKGLGYILSVHGVAYLDIQERVTGEDWDLVFIVLQPDALHGADSALLNLIFHRWGRVCRRYVPSHFETVTASRVARGTDEIQHAEVAAA